MLSKSKNTPKIVAILAHALRAGGGISVGQNILRAIFALAPEHEYLVTLPPRLEYEDIVAVLPKVKILVPDSYDLISRMKFEICTLPREIDDFSPHIILGLGNALCNHRCKAKNVLLVHNSYIWTPLREITWKTPLLSKLKTLTQQILFRRHIKQTDMLLTQTNDALWRIERMYHYDKEHILLPNILSQQLFSDDIAHSNPFAFLSNFACINNNFKLLYLARYYPQKNIEILVDMFIKHRERLRGVVLFITIAPEHGEGSRRVLDAIRDNGLEEAIINLGPVPQSSLAWIYSHMDAIVMPTLLESFSGSYLEAMHFGVPILTSDRGFARSVCGDAAVYFDPLRAESVLRAVLDLKDDAELRHELVERGHRRMAECYSKSWDQMVVELLERIEAL